MSVIAADRKFVYLPGQTEALRVIMLREPTIVTFAWDFDSKIDPGVTISSAAVTEIDGDALNPLTIGSATVQQHQVICTLEDWVSERRYRLRCTATLSDSSVIPVEGLVEVMSES